MTCFDTNYFTYFPVLSHQHVFNNVEWKDGFRWHPGWNRTRDTRNMKSIFKKGEKFSLFICRSISLIAFSKVFKKLKYNFLNWSNILAAFYRGARVQFQTSPCGIFAAQSGNGTGFSPSTLVVLCYRTVNAPYSYFARTRLRLHVYNHR